MTYRNIYMYVKRKWWKYSLKCSVLYNAVYGGPHLFRAVIIVSGKEAKLIQRNNGIKWSFMDCGVI